MTKESIYARHWAKWANDTYCKMPTYKPEHLKPTDVDKWIYVVMDEWANFKTAQLEKENKELHERIARLLTTL